MKKRPFRFSFDPSQGGLRKLLGELEAEVMHEFWRRGAATVRDIHRTVGPRRELAYTTVMTVVSRLADKGLLCRDGKDGAAWVYAPAMSRDEFTRTATASILTGLMRDFGGLTMSGFVDVVETDEEIEELARLVAKRRRKPQ